MPTPRMKKLMTVRRGLFRHELIGLAVNGEVFVWRPLRGFGIWRWERLDNELADTPGAGGFPGDV